MSKLFVRLTVIAIALYFAICHIAMMVWQIYLWSHTYVILLELCVCLCLTAQGTYHCKFIRWTAYSICFTDILTAADELFDFLPYTVSIVIPVAIIALGLSATLTLSIRHYIKVKRLKRIWEIKRKNHQY